MASQKAANFARDAEDAGWKAEIEELDGDETRVTASRGNEQIEISWFGEACRKAANYRNGSYTRTLRNASACRQQLESSSAIEPPSNRVVPRKISRQPSPQPVAPTIKTSENDEDEYVPERTLGDEMLLMSEKDIIDMVRGRVVVWTNSITRGMDHASVMADPNQRQLRVEINPKNRQRILTWAAAEGGFRSVYIHRILDLK